MRHIEHKVYNQEKSLDLDKLKRGDILLERKTKTRFMVTQIGKKYCLVALDNYFGEYTVCAGLNLTKPLKRIRDVIPDYLLTDFEFYKRPDLANIKNVLITKEVENENGTK